MRSIARERQEAASRRGKLRAAVLCGYVADAVDAVGAYPAVATAFIAARAAGAGSSETEDAVLAERAWQVRWLADRLSLSA